jgi:hypothetical protein
MSARTILVVDYDPAWPLTFSPHLDELVYVTRKFVLSCG